MPFLQCIEGHLFLATSSLFVTSEKNKWGYQRKKREKATPVPGSLSESSIEPADSNFPSYLQRDTDGALNVDEAFS